jgi:RNA polymerase sigma-70 factor (ECF subfamily)
VKEAHVQRFEEHCGILAGMERQGATARDGLADIVRRARHGDPRAFETLVQDHLEQVWRVVWRILRHREDTEDVVQEVFMAAHRALPAYRGDSSFSTWLHRIAVNKALNYRDRSAEKLRRASVPMAGPGGDRDSEGDGARPHLAELAAPTRSPLEEMEEGELQRRLAGCMDRLPSAWRAILALRIDEDLSYQEIADVQGTALGTVRSRLARARLALRRCIAGEEGSGQEGGGVKR